MSDNPNIPGSTNFELINKDLEIRGDLVIKAQNGKVRTRLDRESGDIFVFNDEGDQIFRLEAEGGNLRVGGNGGDGDILVFQSSADNSGLARFAVGHLDGNRGVLTIGGDTTNGKLVARDAHGRQTVFLDASHGQVIAGGNGVNGRMFVQDGNERPFFGVEDGSLGIGGADTDGQINLRMSDGSTTIRLKAQGGDPGPVATLDVGGNGASGAVRILSKDGKDIGHLSPSGALVLGVVGSAPIGKIILQGGTTGLGFQVDGSGKIEAGGLSTSGQLRLKAPIQNGPPNEVIVLDANSGSMRIGGGIGQGRAGRIDVRDAFDNTNIVIDGEAGDIRLPNADLAEEFSAQNVKVLPPGTIVVATPSGSIEPSEIEYDPRVIGVIAGAGELRPGVVLGHRPGMDQTRAPVAMAGTVFVRASAEQDSIEVGDPLTTSSSLGVAMVARDAKRAPGAVVGKALKRLSKGVALIPMLVAQR